MKTFAISLVAALALVVGAGQALAATHHHAAAKSTLVVAMHDPGCHWFQIQGKFTRTAAVAGPVRVENRDEATLKIASRTTMRYVKVGKSLVLAPGKYVVMMVGQAVDDNYLKLTVR
ncbi:MAG TPA: hypothetical protein VFA37_01135 [Gaiellaceae bacterium]|nr:hypothetical protein [Gaiellaceae bacterium]